MSVLWRETKDVMVSQLNGNIKQTTTMTTIQNPTSIHKSNSYPNTNDQSKTPIQRSPECSLIGAFVAHPITATPVSHHLLHLFPITCFRETEQACKYHGAGPRPARGVTVSVLIIFVLA